MKSVIDSIEVRTGKLPKAYIEWLENGVTGDEKYSMYSLEWIGTTNILNIEISPEGALDGILPIGIFHGVALWCLDNKRGGRVILCPHDDIVASLYAPSVEGWLYRNCLEQAYDFCDEDEIVLKQLKLWAKLIEPSKPEWAEHIYKLAESEVKEFGDYIGVIDESEVSRIVECEFGQEYINGYVEFLLPEE